MKELIKSLIQKAAQFKSYFIFSGIYVSMINFMLILATFKATYEIDISAFILIPIGFLGVILIGFLDYKFVYYHQTKHINKKNDLKHQMDRIEKQLAEVLENNKQ